MSLGQTIEKDVQAVVKDVEGDLGKLGQLFTSGAAQAALSKAASLVTLAIPIIQSIDTLVPNKLGPEVIAAANKLLTSDAKLQPIIAEAAVNPSGAMLALATTLLQKNLPANQAVPALNILNTAVQLAVTAVHA